jgi:mono/diheme cytochrome c family protein
MPAAPAELGKSPWVWAGAGTNTAFAGPWGVTYAANLTPDTATGLGGWSEQQFVATMRTGHQLGTGRPIMPPMPWTNLQHMNDEDLRAVFAYLRVIKPVTNRVPEFAPGEAPAAAKVAQR